ncbi:bacterial bifunctional deaminase-reductase, partial [Tilletiaria anomala UBC 951]
SPATTADRPRVTLTFAQSLDGKIAGEHGKQVAISGKESLKMTHVMRAMHDGILVGIGTLLNDNPQLNARQLASPPALDGLPRPIVLDSTCRTPPDCKVIRNAQTGQGKAPLIVCRAADASVDSQEHERRLALQAAGATVADVPAGASTRDWPSVLKTLYEHGIRSVMIEGGSEVISSLLQAHAMLTVQVDALVVTIGKTMLGKEGVGYEGIGLHDLIHHCTREFGQDSVIAFK